MVSQCQNPKKLWAGLKSAQTDGQTEWFLYTPLNFVHGGYKNTCIMVLKGSHEDLSVYTMVKTEVKIC